MCGFSEAAGIYQLIIFGLLIPFYDGTVTVVSLIVKLISLVLFRVQYRLVEQERAQESSSGSSDDRILEVESSAANKVSEDVLKCLCSIFLRLSPSKGKTMESEFFSSGVTLAFDEYNWQTEFRDPYGICSESRTRDIGPYKDICAIEACSVDLKRKTNASFLIHRLK